MSTTVATDTLPSNVPKLDAKGTNWVIFLVRFEQAARAKGKWGHISGTSLIPTATVPTAPTEVEQDAINTWLKDDDTARYLIGQRIPDSTVIETRNLATAADVWEHVVREFTQKSAFVQAGMRKDFMSFQCPSNGDVPTFFKELATKKETLAECGIVITDDEYISTILQSLPHRYATHASSFLASVKQMTSIFVSATTATASPGAQPALPTLTVSPTALMRAILDEYERVEAEKASSRRNAPARGNSGKDGDAAYSATQSNGRGGSSNKGGGNRFGGKTTQQPTGPCWHCGEKGHIKANCPKKKKDGGKSGETAASAVDAEDDGAWVAECESTRSCTDDAASLLSWGNESISRPSSMPALTIVSDTDEAGDYDYKSSESSEWSLLSEGSGDEFSEVGEDDAGDAEAFMAWARENAPEVYESVNGEGLATPVRASDPATTGTTPTPGTSDTFAAVLTPDDSSNAEQRHAILDSGATKHLSPHRDEFTTFRTIAPKVFRSASKHNFSATGAGEVTLDVPDGTDSSQLQLNEVLYSPQVGYTLVSVGRLDQLGYTLTFGGGKCIIRAPDSTIVGEVPRSERGIYQLDYAAREQANAATEHISLKQLHCRLGHISATTARKMVERGFVTGLSLSDTDDKHFFCESCAFAKATRAPVPKEREGERAKAYGDEIHSDLWGPAPVESKGGKRYIVTFTDDFTRHTHLYLLRTKDETFDAYKKYEAWAKTQHGTAIRTLHSDNGGEYTSIEFSNHLDLAGTERKLTVHDTPEHNGVAERMNRILNERVGALLHASGLPRFLWGEAASHVMWLKNRSPTKALPDGMTPYEALTGKKPSLRGVREWGEKCWVKKKPAENVRKLELPGQEGRWVGIDQHAKGFRVYWPKRKTVTVERSLIFAPAVGLEGEHGDLEDVEFDDAIIHESSLPRAEPQPPVTTTVKPEVKVEVVEEGKKDEAEVEEIIGADPVNNPSRASPAPAPRISTPAIDPDEEANAPRSQRVRKPSRYIRDILDGAGKQTARPSDPKFPRGFQVPGSFGDEGEGADLVEGELEDDEGWIEIALAAVTADAEALEPKTITEARNRADWPLWKAAVDEEMATLKEAGTWRLEHAPEGANIVGSKWVFKAKKDAAGKVARYKARLVAQGFSQVPGVDYFDTYAPVAKLASVRTVLALANRLDFELHQVDIKGAYLNGDLTDKEVIYMRPPPGNLIPDTNGRVLRLIRTLYGLKQSGRRWYQKLVEIFVESMGFSQAQVDQAVFYRRDAKGIIIVVVHVDDCTIAASTLVLIVEFKSELAKYVTVTDLGEAHWLLGIEIQRDRQARTLQLSQRAYIDAILRRFGFDELKPLSMPMDTQVQLTSALAPRSTEEIAAMRDVPYREAVGALMYASLATRPDIAFAVQTVSRFASNPGQAHWAAVKRIFRYLLGTRDLWLTYGGSPRALVGYGDADGSMAEDRRAISGFAFLIDGGAVSWSSKRQEIVSLSTTESEYVAATHATKETLWLRSLIKEILEPIEEATVLFSDNQSAIALAHDHQYHARTKHIDVRYHFIRWIIEEGSMRLVYCPTEDMVADVLTKALPSPKVKHFAAELGLRTA